MIFYRNKNHKKLAFLLVVSLLLTGCSIKSKQRKVEKSEINNTNLIYDNNINKSYKSLDFKYKKIDTDKILTSLIGKDFDSQKVTKGENDMLSYEDDNNEYEWYIHYNNKNKSFTYGINNYQEINKMEVAEAEKFAKSSIESWNLGVEITEEPVDIDSEYKEDGINFTYEFTYDNVPILGNRLIELDSHNDDSALYGFSFITLKIVNGKVTSLDIFNVPEITNVHDTYQSNDFISEDKVLEYVENSPKYPSAKNISKISIRYMPLPKDGDLLYMPVYEVFFVENEENILNSSMLIDAFSGACYD